MYRINSLCDITIFCEHVSRLTFGFLLVFILLLFFVIAAVSLLPGVAAALIQDICQELTSDWSDCKGGRMIGQTLGIGECFVLTSFDGFVLLLVFQEVRIHLEHIW